MDDKTAKKLLKRAKISARKFGFQSEAEDLSQDVLLAFVSNPETKQTVDQACIDAIRVQHGRTGTGYDDGLPRRRRNKDKHEILEEEKIPSSTGFCRDGLRPLDPDLLQYLDRIEKTDRAILILHYAWGITEKELGICFGVTESRICQRISNIQTRLSQIMATEEQRQTSQIFQTIQINRERQRELARLLPTVCQEEGQTMAVSEACAMAEEESWQMESPYEESIPEWFA